MPPPPAPSFLQHRLRDNATALPCGGGAQLCASGEWEPPRGDYVELSRQDVGTADDTWPLVLVAASVGVLVLGALLALFLLRCREQHGAKEHQQHQQHRAGGKAAAAAVTTAPPSIQSNEPSGDSRAVCWAALTPRGGTQHFVSLDDEENHHYETVDGPWYRASSGNYEYEEPVLLTSPSPVPAWLQQQQDMRCISTLRRPRPRVSPPTRIEHPNLPPLNLNPLVGPPPPPPPRRPPTVGTLSRRPSDANTILKYNIN